MTVLGIILLVLGLILGLHILFWLGVLLLVCGLVFLALHHAGHSSRHLY